MATTQIPDGIPDQPPPAASARARSVTWRSVALGALGVATISLLADFTNNTVQAPPMVGNHLPIFPMAAIIVLALVWNPLAGRLWSRLRLEPGELTVVLVMMLCAAWLPGYGFYRTFHVYLIRPWLAEPAHADWIARQTLEYLPSRLFPLAHDQADPSYQKVYGDFETGIPVGDGVLSVAQAPWRAWLPIMAYWGPLIGCLALSMSALALLVHRQWSRHEQLAYPLATVFSAMIPKADGRIPEVFRSRLFWMGAAPPFIFYLINYLAILTHGKFPWISSAFYVGDDFSQLFPVLKNVDLNLRGWTQFMIIGIAYFIPSEISFSFGTNLLWFALVSVQVYAATGKPMSNVDCKSIVAGAYVAYALILVYTGRTYYRSMMARALRARRASDEGDNQGVWAARVFLAASAGLTLVLWWGFGLDWMIAVVYVLAVQMFFLVVTRIICETGVPFMQAEFDSGMVLANIMGFPALGPSCLVMIYWLGSVINFDTRVCMMPFVANGLKVAENTGTRVGGLVAAGLGAMALAAVLGFAAQTYTTYAYGGKRDNFHVLESTLPSTIDQATRGLGTLADTGRFDSSSAAHGLAKLGLLGENVGHGKQLSWMGFGMAGVLALVLVRFRYPGFWLHPIIFLIWDTWPCKFLWFSFLLGWCLKESIVRFGGASGYRTCKPLFLGLILGEIMCGALLTVGAFLHWLITGAPGYTGFTGG